MHVASICTRSLVTCHLSDPVADIARQLRDCSSPDVVVLEEAGDQRRPMGVITARDIVKHVVADNRDARATTAAGLLCGPCETVFEDELIYDAIAHMRSKRLRHLPVVDKHGSLVGLLRADDVTEFLASELMELARIVPLGCEGPAHATEPRVAA